MSSWIKYQCWIIVIRLLLSIEIGLHGRNREAVPGTIDKAENLLELLGRRQNELGKDIARNTAEDEK